MQELEETVVLVDNIIDGNVSLTQKAAWQPLTVNWKGIKVGFSLGYSYYLLAITITSSC